jgi:23S rRNA pseudouridine2605 synthase
VSVERLQKVLARGGIASRRAAEELISSGRVRVNGRVVRELGTKVGPGDRIDVDGQRVVAEQYVYVLLHKPRGVVSTMNDPEGRPTVAELLADVGARVFPVGRLDFNTSGVLLATNDGEFSNGLLHPRKAVEKTYIVKLNGEMKPKDVDRWRQGVRLDDGTMTRPADVSLLRHEGGKTWLEVTLREGKNRQIKRMGDATGFSVMRLARVSFAGIRAEGLLPGTWRLLSRDELMQLKKEYGVPRRLPHGVPMSTGGTPMSRARTHGARYGGGAPGRRSFEVEEDWGGTIGRGRTERQREQERGREHDRDRRPRGELGDGGRGGRTRTTGTAGGVKFQGR